MSLTSSVVWLGSTGTTAPVIMLLPSTSLKLLGIPDEVIVKHGTRRDRVEDPKKAIRVDIKEFIYDTRY